MQFVCDETGLTYELKRSSRRRTLAIQIGSSGLQVHAPLYLDQQLITAFVVKKQAWIRQHLSAQVAPVNHVARGRLPLLDGELTLRQVRDDLTATTRDGDELWVQISHRVKAANVEATVKQQLISWYTQQAQSWFAGRIAVYSKRMSVQPGALLIKGWQTKWGSCHTNGTISLNWRLMLAPSWVADYVVVHELAHLVHMNHGDAYWQLVQQHYPQWQDAKGWLKVNQQKLNLI